MRPLTIVAAVAALTFSAPAPGSATELKEVQHLLKTIDEGMFPTVAAASMKITSYKKDVEDKQLAMDLMINDDKALIGITAPVIDKGKYILKSGKNLWMFFSDIKRSIRLSTRDSFMGTDANNYDVLQLNVLRDYDLTGYSDATLDGKPLVKADLVAKKGTEGYQKIASWIDPEARRLVQNDCYSISGTLIKSIRYQETRQVGKYRVPASVLIVNHVDKDRRTRMEFLRVEPRDDVRASVFTLGYLESLD
jgi:hypothetical protein